MTERLLKRLLKKAKLSADAPPADQDAWKSFLHMVSVAMAELKERQEIYENALAMSTAEMERLYHELKTKSEDELADRRRFLKEVVDALPVAVFCKDCSDDFRFLLWNRKAEDTFDLRPEQVIGKTDFDIFPQDQAARFRAIDIDDSKNLGTSTIPEQAVAGVRKTIYVRTHKTVLADAHGRARYLLSVAEDITEERLVKGKMVASARLSSLGEMAAGVAHEINNPLAIIHGKSTVLSMQLAKSPPDVPGASECAQQIAATCHRIENIVHGLRSLSRDGGSDPLTSEAIQDIITQAVSMCGERLHNHGVDLRLVLPSHPIRVDCRLVQIGQVLINLINNAFDAIKNSPEKWIELKIVDSNEWLQLHVTDSGSGIPLAVREHMMQPFYTTKRIGEGTGLGLSISHSILESHGGSLRYDESCANTRFIIAIPRRHRQSA